MWNGVESNVFTSERSIGAEVVTYRLDVAFGSLLMQQLHGFDELRNDQPAIRNRSAKIERISVSLYLSAAEIIEQIENGKNCAFWSFRWSR
jgi:hypothetical protein